jgi:hypothetical protein
MPPPPEEAACTFTPRTNAHSHLLLQVRALWQCTHVGLRGGQRVAVGVQGKGPGCR